ncbi:MAG: zinc ribbon domain-containing protein, partial [Myxococcota bacterium]
MIGILSYGAYIPRTRLPLRVIAGLSAKEGDPEKAVTWNDEDAITLGVTAGVHCLAGFDRSQIDMLIFASTTLPFQEKQAASLAARALDLPRDIQTADQTGSIRAGTTAIRAAFDAVRAGSAKSVLVIASDARVAAPGSSLETKFGDGAAAFLIADGECLASLDRFAAVSEEITDVWRPTGHDFVHTWEDRFVVQQSFLPNMRRVIQKLLDQTKGSMGDFNRVALSAPDARSHATLAKAVGVSPSALQPSLFGRLGNAGAAFAPLQLIAALEEAGSEEQILLVSFGDGAEASSFRTTKAIEKCSARRGVDWNLTRRRVITRYEDYIKAKGLSATEWEAGTSPGLSATILHRERDDDLSLLGQRCQKCQAIQFPAQRLCESCYAKDDFEKVRLSDRVGKIVTYTFDFFFPTPNPPTIVTIVDVDGARIHLQIVEANPEEIEIDQEIEFVFRRI